MRHLKASRSASCVATSVIGAHSSVEDRRSHRGNIWIHRIRMNRVWRGSPCACSRALDLAAAPPCQGNRTFHLQTESSAGYVFEVQILSHSLRREHLSRADRLVRTSLGDSADNGLVDDAERQIENLASENVPSDLFEILSLCNSMQTSSISILRANLFFCV
jgi:hypothetical protein